MANHQYRFILILCIVTSLGVFSFVSCIAAEINRAKIKDLKFDGRLCYLPGSQAFGFGIAALTCLCIAQIIGNLMVCRNFFSRETSSSKATNPLILTFLMFISWVSFGIAVILLSGGTSMSTRQTYGKGWLEGECYLVKDGVFIGSGCLVLLTIVSTLGSALTSKRNETQVDHQSALDDHQLPVALDPKF
ncbi:hypothetical protein UlMin_000270 [Ulmus minor]